MTDAELSRAVADRMGLREIRCVDRNEDDTITDWYELRDTDGTRYRPDFATSLDAMAAAEATMTSQERRAYAMAIGGASSLVDTSSMRCLVDAWLFAPPSVRATCFLEVTKERGAK